MRGRSRRPADEAEVNMTPMLDIVFILLIFFIVTAVFIQERALNLTPPPPSNTENTEPQPTIIIRVDEDNLVFVNNRLVDIGTVRSNIERLRAETPESAVLVQAHPNARSGLVVQIVDQARTANVQNVGFVLSDI